MQFTININKENIGRAKAADARQYLIAPTFKRFVRPARTLLSALLFCLLASAAIVSAQNKPAPTVTATPQANPLSAFNKRAYGLLMDWLIRSAEKMPEENYNFKPADGVRSYGQIIGHVADFQYRFCSAVLDEKNPTPEFEKTKTSKADLIAALKSATAYCDKAYNDMTDASGLQTVKLFGGDIPKMSLLNVNIAHNSEHYGNLVTYLRMKNIVPPSSEAAKVTQPKK